MELGKTFYAKDRREWRAWLSKNHRREKEVWLVYFRKASGKPRIPYNDAVEEALCFGWIDSTVKKVDADCYAQRFTPRRPGSGLSPANRERIRKLIAAGSMTPAGLAAVSHAFKPNGRDKKFAVAKGILAEIKKNARAWRNFKRLPDGYKRIRIGYIEGRRRHCKEAFEKSLRHFVKMTEKGKRFGFIRE